MSQVEIPKLRIPSSLYLSFSFFVTHLSGDYLQASIVRNEPRLKRRNDRYKDFQLVRRVKSMMLLSNLSLLLAQTIRSGINLLYFASTILIEKMKHKFYLLIFYVKLLYMRFRTQKMR